MIGLEYVLKLFEMTQQELADKLEIKRQNIDSWIRGQRKIPQKHLSKLIEIFNIPEKYFQRELKFYDEERIQLMKLHGINNERDLGYGVVDTEWTPTQEFIENIEKRKQEELVRFNSKRENLINSIQKMLDLDLGSTNYSSSIISTQIASKELNLEFIKSLIEVYNDCQGYQSEVLGEILTSFELLQGKNLPYKYTEQSNIDFYNSLKEDGYVGGMPDNIDKNALEFIYKIRNLIKEEEERIEKEQEEIRENIRAMGFEESED